MSLDDARTFLSGWVSGYLMAGGSLTDDGLGERAAGAFSRYLDPPEPVVVRLEQAIEAAQAADARANHNGPSTIDHRKGPS